MNFSKSRLISVRLKPIDRISKRMKRHFAPTAYGDGKTIKQVGSCSYHGRIALDNAVAVDRGSGLCSNLQWPINTSVQLPLARDLQHAECWRVTADGMATQLSTKTRCISTRTTWPLHSADCAHCQPLHEAACYDLLGHTSTQRLF